MFPSHLRKSHLSSEADKQLLGKSPPKYAIGDKIPAKALGRPRTAPRLISQAAVPISVV